MKPNQKLATKDGVQVALFPLENMRVTQGVNDTYSHKNSLAIDLNTRGVWDKVYAPFDCKVVSKRTKHNEVIFQSLKPVLCADGNKSIVVLKLLHDNDISDITVGKTFKQGDKIYDEGGTGANGTVVYANHIHLSVSKTPYDSKVSWFDVDVRPELVFFINDTKIIDNEGYNWKTYVEPIEPIKPKLKVGDRVFIKKTATTYATGQLIPPEYKKGGRYAQEPFTISFDGNNSMRKLVQGSWLLSEIKSWVEEEDLEKV